MDNRQASSDRRSLLVIAWVYLLLILVGTIGFVVYVMSGKSGRSLQEWADLLEENALLLGIAAALFYLLAAGLYFGVSRLLTRRRP